MDGIARPQYSLRELLAIVTMTGLVSGFARLIDFDWSTALWIASFVLALIFAAIDKAPIGWRTLTSVAICCTFLLWLGVSPGLYYMAAPIFMILLWVAIAVLGIVRITALRRRESSDLFGAVRSRVVGIRLLACFAMPMATVLLIVLKIPLLLGFLTAWPALSDMVPRVGPDGSLPISADTRCGLYTISASWPRTCCLSGGAVFVLADDLESAFIYSPTGISSLCYNKGNSGHLFGNWYWMKED